MLRETSCQGSRVCSHPIFAAFWEASDKKIYSTCPDYSLMDPHLRGMNVLSTRAVLPLRLVFRVLTRPLGPISRRRSPQASCFHLTSQRAHGTMASTTFIHNDERILFQAGSLNEWYKTDTLGEIFSTYPPLSLTMRGLSIGALLILILPVTPQSIYDVVCCTHCLPVQFRRR